MTPSALLRLLPLALALAAARAAAQAATCCAVQKTVTARGFAHGGDLEHILTATVGVEQSGPTAFGVRVSVGDGVVAVTDYLAAQGAAVSNVQTTGSQMRVHFKYEYGESGNVCFIKTFREFTANARVSLDLGQDVYDVLTGLQHVPGATISIENLATREEKYDLVAAQRAALQNAVYAARENAERMAFALDKAVGDPISVKNMPDDNLQIDNVRPQVVRAEATVIYELV